MFCKQRPTVSRLPGDLDEVVEVFDVTLHLGPVEAIVFQENLSEEDLLTIRTVVNKSSDEERFVNICFKNHPDRPIRVEYRKWMAADGTEPACEENPQ